MSRRVFSRHWFRVQKVAPMVNTGLLVINTSLATWALIAWRGWSVYFAAPLIMVALAALIVGFANVWVLRMRMHETDRSAAVLHDPAQVYAHVPWEQTVWLGRDLPLWQHLIDVHRADGHDVTAWQAHVDKMAAWARQGFVPIEEAPPEVRRHYMGTRGHAL